MRHPPAILLSLVTLFSGLAVAIGVGSMVSPQHLRDTERWLRAMEYGSKLQSDFGRNNRAGARAPWLDALLKAPPAEVEAVIAPVFAEMFLEADVRELAEFYESRLGQRVTGKIVVPRAQQIRPSDEEFSEQLAISRFMRGRLGTESQKWLRDAGIRQRYTQALRRHFTPPLRPASSPPPR